MILIIDVYTGNPSFFYYFFFVTRTIRGAWKQLDASGVVSVPRQVFLLIVTRCVFPLNKNSCLFVQKFVLNVECMYA